MVQFYLWFKSFEPKIKLNHIYLHIKVLFPLFCLWQFDDNEFETKETKFEPRIKLNHNRYACGLIILDEIKGNNSSFSLVKGMALLPEIGF